MKNKKITHLCILVLFTTIILPTCTPTPQQEFSLKNTLTIFLLNNEKGHYFCFPVQYIGDFQIQSFEYSSGSVTIGEYEILLKREDVNISAYLDETSDEYGNSDSLFNLIYLEENSNILLSKMDEPLESENMYNYYYIFIERYINEDEMKNIISEYEKGNVYSKLYIQYDLVIDNEPQAGSGFMDDFELYYGLPLDTTWFPADLDFFKFKYLQK